MCKYCEKSEDNEPVLNGITLNYSVGISKQEDPRIVMASGDLEESMIINYCLMCGEKLR